MKNFIIFILLVTKCCSTNAASPIDLNKERNFSAKIAVVNIEAIFEHSVAIKDLKERINQISESIQQDMSKYEIDLKKTEEQLVKQKGIIAEKEFQEKVALFNAKVSEAQKILQSRKSALEQAHSHAISAVHKTTLSIIGDLSKQYGFNVVLPSSQVLFIENELNVTMEVITLLNQKLKTIEIKYEPAL